MCTGSLIGASSDGEVIAWIEAVLRHEAYRVARSAQSRAGRYERLVEDLAETVGADQQWEAASDAAVDVAVLCDQLSGREGVACRMLAAVGPLSERELGRRMGVSQPTAHRLKHALAVKVQAWIGC